MFQLDAQTIGPTDAALDLICFCRGDEVQTAARGVVVIKTDRSFGFPPDVGAGQTLRVLLQGLQQALSLERCLCA